MPIRVVIQISSHNLTPIVDPFSLSLDDAGEWYINGAKFVIFKQNAVYPVAVDISSHDLAMVVNIRRKRASSAGKNE